MLHGEVVGLEDLDDSRGGVANGVSHVCHDVQELVDGGGLRHSVNDEIGAVDGEEAVGVEDGRSHLLESVVDFDVEAPVVDGAVVEVEREVLVAVCTECHDVALEEPLEEPVHVVDESHSGVVVSGNDGGIEVCGDGDDMGIVGVVSGGCDTVIDDVVSGDSVLEGLDGHVPSVDESIDICHAVVKSVGELLEGVGTLSRLEVRDGDPVVGAVGVPEDGCGVDDSRVLEELLADHVDLACVLRSEEPVGGVLAVDFEGLGDGEVPVDSVKDHFEVGVAGFGIDVCVVADSPCEIEVVLVGEDLEDDLSTEGAVAFLGYQEGFALVNGDESGLRNTESLLDLSGDAESSCDAGVHIGSSVLDVIDSVQIEGIVSEEGLEGLRFQLCRIDERDKRSVRRIDKDLDDTLRISCLSDVVTDRSFQKRVDILDEGLARVGRGCFGVIRYADEACSEDGYQHGDDEHVAVFHLNH